MNQNVQDLLNEARKYSEDGTYWVFEEPDFSFLFLWTKEYKAPTFFVPIPEERATLRLLIQRAVETVLHGSGFLSTEYALKWGDVRTGVFAGFQSMTRSLDLETVRLIERRLEDRLRDDVNIPFLKDVSDHILVHNLPPVFPSISPQNIDPVFILGESYRVDRLLDMSIQGWVWPIDVSVIKSNLKTECYSYSPMKTLIKYLDDDEERMLLIAASDRNVGFYVEFLYRHFPDIFFGRRVLHYRDDGRMIAVTTFPCDED
jgi:hypothetical protein